MRERENRQALPIDVVSLKDGMPKVVRAGGAWGGGGGKAFCFSSQNIKSDGGQGIVWTHTMGSAGIGRQSKRRRG